MASEEIIELRNKILGALIHAAREKARSSREACAEVLGISAGRMAAYEQGAKAISLPELELLGRFLEVPLYRLREDEPNTSDEPQFDLPPADFFLPLRHRIVGARLRQARLESGRTQEDLAELLSCSNATISDYEYGERPISVAELEILARALAVPIDIFFDNESEVGAWHRLQADFESFAELPPEMRAFVLRPINRSYLELAIKLSEMPAGALRQIAEGLLEITL